MGSLEWQWDETLFAGTAPYYERGRLPYAPRLAEAMAEALHLDGHRRLLDAGCGPGTVALRLAHLFEAVVGLDADPEMLAEAGRLSVGRGISKARWVHARAEEMPGDLGTFRVVTFAQSFHWMDRLRVARTVFEMLEPGGAVVHVDSRYQDGVDPGPGVPYPAPPEAAIADLRRRYLGPDRRAGRSVRNAFPDREDLVFREAGFVGPEVVVVRGWGMLERSTEDVVANVFSNSATAPHLFGVRVATFEAELRQLLAAVSPSGRFSVHLRDNILNIWRPAGLMVPRG